VIAQGTGSELKDRVGGQILEVELVSPAQRDNARAALAGIGCGDPEPGASGRPAVLPSVGSTSSRCVMAVSASCAHCSRPTRMRDHTENCRSNSRRNTRGQCPTAMLV
jgi:hypothetical protein